MKNKKSKNHVTMWVWLPAVIIAVLFLIRFMLPFILILFSEIENSENILKLYKSADFSSELCLTIIGVAITVSVGLNIYNTIEKNELNELRQNALRFEATMNAALEQERVVFLRLLQDVHGDALMEFFCDEFNKELTGVNASIYDIHLSKLINIQRAYVLAYNSYNANTRGHIFNSTPLLQALNEWKKSGIVLLDVYYNFIYADYYYFGGDYSHAISFYQNAFNLIENQPIYSIANVYLLNSLGWSYCKDKKYKDALELFEKMSKVITEFEPQITDKYNRSYLARYYRNYGAAYEMIGTKDALVEAIEWYTQAEKYHNIHEYKILVTKAAATMKLWDCITFKTSENWEKYVSGKLPLLYNGKGIIEINAKQIEMILLDLKIAELCCPDFSDIYAQRAKALIYRFLLKGSSEEDKIFYNLSIAQRLGGTTMYVERDYYHAMWLTSSNKKDEYASLFVNINNEIHNPEADEFRKIGSYSKRNRKN